jgi:hypothetical protein
MRVASRVLSLAAAALAGVLLASPATMLGQSAPAQAAAPLRWPVRTLDHVDLWLHAFALLDSDSSAVPIYRRGYRDSLTVIKNRRNILTALDGNRDALQRGLARRGYLDAQFLAFGFNSWDGMRAVLERFLQLEGDPRRAGDRELTQLMAGLAGLFPSAADREWLRLFVAGVQDEYVRFFRAEHATQLRARAATITAIDSLWQQVYRARFERFLNNTGQRQGDVLLTLSLGGEGRTGPGAAGRPMVAVTWPEQTSDAVEVLYVLAHEITGSLVGPVVADNVTPAQQRSGEASRLVSLAQVRTGALLLTRVAPELLAGYQRYYLAQTGRAVASDASDDALTAAFDEAFPLPGVIAEALARQVDIVLAGI